MAFARYGDPDVAWHHLEQLARAVAAAPGGDEVDPADRFVEEIAEMRVASEDAWRGLVGTEGFARWFTDRHADRSDRVAADRLETGVAHGDGRRSRRASGDPLGVLVGAGAREPAGVVRARHRAAGGGVAAGRARSPASDAPGVAVPRGAPGERGALACQGRSRAGRALPRSRGSCGPRGRDLRGVGPHRATAPRGHRGATACSPTGPSLHAAIDLRAPYVDALSFLQLRFIDDARATHLVQATIGGVAAGMQNTG